MDLDGKTLTIKAGIKVWVLLSCNVKPYLDVCDKEGFFKSGQSNRRILMRD